MSKEPQHMSMRASRPLMLRANRLLGSGLVEANLVTVENLQLASGRLLEISNTETARNCTVLGVLINEMKVLREEDLLTHLVEKEGLALVDLRCYEVTDEAKKKIDPGVCWSTWTVPFDCVDDFHLVASAYYLSPAVRSHWEKELKGPIIWYGATLDCLGEFIGKLEAERATAAAEN